MVAEMSESHSAMDAETSLRQYTRRRRSYATALQSWKLDEISIGAAAGNRVGIGSWSKTSFGLFCRFRFTCRWEPLEPASVSASEHPDTEAAEYRNWHEAETDLHLLNAKYAEMSASHGIYWMLRCRVLAHELWAHLVFADAHTISVSYVNCETLISCLYRTDETRS